MMVGLRQRLVDRNTLPRWLNRVIDEIADRPNSIVGRIAALRFGRTPRGIDVAVSRFASTSTRLLIAPVNYASQAHEWARALEHHRSGTSVSSMAVEVPGGFGFPSDLVVPVSTFHNDSRWQRRQFDVVTSIATHVLIEALEPPFGRAFGRDIERQARALMARGLSVAFMCHGTEIRLPSRNVQATPWSLYNDPAVYTPRLEHVAGRNAGVLRRLGVPVFVSTPDLLDDVPNSTWCPVVIDPARWETLGERTDHDGPIRVFHAPSISVHKGTPLIIETLERLHSEGIIEFHGAERIPSPEMPARYARTDVFLDQFRVGSYGVAACEAMASGCSVVGHVTERVRERVKSATGLNLPIIEADPSTLENVLRALASEGCRRATASSQGWEFVSAVHDGRASARVLTGWLDREGLGQR